MNFHKWKADTESLLVKLRAIDFGYPLGENIICDVAEEHSLELGESLDSSASQDLREFYSICDGIRWPDVHNGYFLKEHGEIGIPRDEYEPTQVDGPLSCSVIVVGSTGTGALFAVSREGELLLLQPRRIEKNIYFDPDGTIQVVAPDFSTFCQLLLKDLEAFVEDKPGHSYIT